MSMPKSNLFQTALEIGPTKKLSTGCPILDRFLSGGILTEGITEICGESGAGKTQLCMQLALTAQYPTDMGGLNGGVIYICTEEQFHSRRLQQIIENFPFELNGKIKPKINFMDNLFITRVTDVEKFENSFNKIIFLVENKNIKLIILDSVTALFRGSSTDIEGFQKAKDLRTIVRFFYKLCGTYKVATVCVNQVSQVLDSEVPEPALGLVWANLVTTRIQLKKQKSMRKLCIIFSPTLPPQEIEYKISAGGLFSS